MYLIYLFNFYNFFINMKESEVYKNKVENQMEKRKKTEKTLLIYLDNSLV